MTCEGAGDGGCGGRGWARAREGTVAAAMVCGGGGVCSKVLRVCDSAWRRGSGTGEGEGVGAGEGLRRWDGCGVRREGKERGPKCG